jgi:hypothetical protein
LITKNPPQKTVCTEINFDLNLTRALLSACPQQ